VLGTSPAAPNTSGPATPSPSHKGDPAKKEAPAPDNAAAPRSERPESAYGALDTSHGDGEINGFVLGESDITTAQQQAISDLGDKIVTQIKANPGGTVHVDMIGHADTVYFHGQDAAQSDYKNWQLGEDRAVAATNATQDIVKAKLKASGMTDDQVAAAIKNVAFTHGSTGDHKLEEWKGDNVADGADRRVVANIKVTPATAAPAAGTIPPPPVAGPSPYGVPPQLAGQQPVGPFGYYYPMGGVVVGGSNVVIDKTVIDKDHCHDHDHDHDHNGDANGGGLGGYDGQGRNYGSIIPRAPADAVSTHGNDTENGDTSLLGGLLHVNIGGGSRGAFGKRSSALPMKK
jgi:outer membrane protein OmpA-like peptidoglycan-associated protein